MTSVRRALVFSIGERYILIALSLLGGILIARILTPEEIGIYSVSLAVVGLTQVLRDFGIGNFLIQEENLTDEHIRTAFGLSLLIGSVLFLVTVVGAPFAAEFYNESRLLDTMRISALNFLILPFCSISLALLRRSMMFQRLAFVTVAAAIVSFLTSVLLAYHDFGPVSLALGVISGNVVMGFGTWVARSDRRMLLPSFSEWRAMVKFGAQSSAANVVTSVSMDINDLVLGKLMGFAPVAMISRAQGVMSLFHRDFMSAIRNVAYPSYARAHREGEILEQRYIESVAMVTVFAWPFYGFAGMFSLEIMRLMFGVQWDEAARLVPVFCLAGAFAATSNLATSAMMAVGRNDLVTNSELIFQPVRACMIIVAAFIYESLLACAIAYLIAFVIYPPFIYAFKKRCINNDFTSLFGGLWLSAKVSIVALSIPAAISIFAGVRRDAPVSLSLFIIACGSFSIALIAALIIFKHPFSQDPLFKRLAGYFRLRV